MLAATLLCTLIVAAPASSGSTTNDATLGAALAWELGEKLRVGAIDEAHAMMRVGELSPEELRKFLSAWAMAAPPIDVAVRVRLEAERRLAEPASVEVGPREPEPGGLKDPPPQVDTAPPPPEFPNVEDAAARAWARDAKSPVLSVLLSVFIGFGAGNFYAERCTYGAVVAAVQVLGGIAIGFGVGKDKDALLIAGLSGLLVGRLADTIGAGFNTVAYNDEHRPHLGLSARDAALVPTPMSVVLPLLTW